MNIKNVKVNDFLKIGVSLLIGSSIMYFISKYDKQHHSVPLMSDPIQVGVYNNMPISFVTDNSPNPAKGFYIIDDTKFKKDGKTSVQLSSEKLLGKYKDLNVYFVTDMSDKTNSTGFYIFKNAQGTIISTVNMIQAFQSGNH